VMSVVVVWVIVSIVVRANGRLMAPALK